MQSIFPVSAKIPVFEDSLASSIVETGGPGIPQTPADDSGLASESRLMAMVEQGDEQALSRLFDLHSKLIYSVALRILRDPREAEGVLQEVYLQMWREPGAFTSLSGSLRGWLSVTTRNRSIDILRQRRPMDWIDDLPLAMASSIISDAEHLVLVGLASSAIASLPEEQRSALEMAFFEGRTHAEIARASGVPVSTIKTSIRRGLQALRECWAASSAVALVREDNTS